MQDKRDSFKTPQQQNAGAAMGANAGGSGNATNPFTSGKFISSGVIEDAIRRGIETASKQGISPIRLAMLAAQTHGRNWFSVWDAFKQLEVTGKEPHPKQLAQRMQILGLTETRMHVVGGKEIYQARLRADVMMFDAKHIHGRIAMRLATDINSYYAVHGDASGVAALLLIGIHFIGLTNSTDLRRFCEPQHSYDYPSSMTSKILKDFAKEGMVEVIRTTGKSVGAFTVIPVGNAV